MFSLLGKSDIWVKASRALHISFCLQALVSTHTQHRRPSKDIKCPEPQGQSPFSFLPSGSAQAQGKAQPTHSLSPPPGRCPGVPELLWQSSAKDREKGAKGLET